MKFVSLAGLEQFLTNVKAWVTSGFVGKEAGKGLSSNDYTSAEKTKLAGLQNTTVDSTLSSSSTNPVQNKVINSALSGKVPTTRKVNNKALSADITLSAGDVSAIPASQKGAANGVAELDATGKVPAAQLPSYVDDVLEYDAQASFPTTGETGKIYISKDNNKTYRWSGTAYVEISASIALGETSSTAYRGDRGKAAYDHSQTAHAPANAEQNVQSDWNITDSASDAYIKNKPASLPANGGNAATVGGHTVGVDVPSNAKFTDTTYTDFKAATASAAGSNGLVPAPAAGKQSMYLRGDGTWQMPTDTRYNHPTGDGNLHVPATGTTNNGKFLQAGATAGSVQWAAASKSTVGLGNVDNTSDANKPVSTAQQAALDNKVDKVSGKVLSTNDYTTTEKNKLDGIAASAQVNVLESVKVNGTALGITSKAVNIDLTSYAKTADMVEVTSAEIDALFTA